MQLFGRFGGEIGTVVLDARPRDTILSLKQSLLTSCSCLATETDLIVSYGGRVCRDSWSLRKAGIGPGSTLEINGRLLGGGGDGGSTGAESRQCYLEMYAGKRKDKVNPVEEKLAKFTTCHLSGEPLQPPCVCDELGNIYNKDAVLQALVSKTVPKTLPQITGLKSLINVQLTRNSKAKPNAAKAAAKLDNFQLGNEAEYCCPISGLEFNGRFKFVVLRSTGHVVSEKAIKELTTAVEEHIGTKVDKHDCIPVNPTGEELDALKEKLMLKLAAARSKKKDKRNKADTEESNGENKKRHKAGLPVPAGATKEVYASIFTSACKNAEKETYLCRSVAARGMNLT